MVAQRNSKLQCTERLKERDIIELQDKLYELGIWRKAIISKIIDIFNEEGGDEDEELINNDDLKYVVWMQVSRGGVVAKI